ncbi:response regulator transcription factor [Aquimarina latercula]|uniref:response regulator transcription factor n=1 Tax=Aquimarina latercula TaxID=987 RepID=UPI000414430D|nr:response regulator transcription factor [Aquimarina latercula]
MFKKVLVAEDIDNINQGLKEIKEALQIAEMIHVQYCDDALLKIKRANLDNDPFDLLISDLSFKKDHREQKLTSGEQLIEAVKKEQPTIKTIAYSIEDRPEKVKSMFTNLGINGFVCKDRKGLKELSKAITEVSHHRIYISPQVEAAMRNGNTIEFDAYDAKLIQQLANGLTQEQIGIYFKNNGIAPSSISSVEKRLNKLKIDFKANNATHLVAIVKDLGLI